MAHKYIIELEDRKQCKTTIGQWQGVVELYATFMRTIAVVDEAVAERFDIGEYLPEMVTFKGGELSKSMDMACQIWDMLVECGADRQTVLVAIGGGSVCDMVNFVASTYMRGIKVVLLPTTLLAQVDAAIGGKCGVNVGGYKNMVGTFNLPCDVVCDTQWLCSLPEREWRSGMAEVIKTAVVGDAELFEILEGATPQQIRTDEALCESVVARCVKVKSEIVTQDPYDKGVRKVLNLGHTLGHAIESLTGDYSHGEAVAVGLARVSKMAVEKGVMSEADCGRIVALLERYGLPTTVDLPEEQLLAAMLHDKKNAHGEIGWVLPRGIGNMIPSEKELSEL